MSYKQSVTLKHNETLAKIDKETGEITEVKNRGGNPKASYHLPKAKFTKDYNAAMIYLSKHLTTEELGIVQRMIIRARPYTNSLNPLNDDSSLRTLAEEFKIGKNRVKRSLNRLFDLGVYGKFEVVESNKEYTKYWILNPYIAFNGKVIDKGIQQLFMNTDIAKISQLS